jgi:hypothetical protein
MRAENTIKLVRRDLEAHFETKKNTTVKRELKI